MKLLIAKRVPMQYSGMQAGAYGSRGAQVPIDDKTMIVVEVLDNLEAAFEITEQ